MNQPEMRRDELAFVLEADERRFLTMLRARLLDEGCNLPLALAKRRFYAALLTRFAELSALGKSVAAPVTHAEFCRAIRAYLPGLADAERMLALEATRAIDMVTRAWQLDDALFQASGEQFAARLRTVIAELWQANGMTPADGDADALRRRLYVALPAALLSKMRVRTEFVREFGSMPNLLAAIAADHAQFCRVMAFCRERSPYFLFLASQTFWRTVETFRLERLASHPELA